MCQESDTSLLWALLLTAAIAEGVYVEGGGAVS
jgi:hypothetical protein